MSLWECKISVKCAYFKIFSTIFLLRNSVKAIGNGLKILKRPKTSPFVYNFLSYIISLLFEISKIWSNFALENLKVITKMRIKKRNVVVSLATVAVFIGTTMFSASCQESLEERCARESKEFNEKKCPAKVSEGVMLDSLVFERESHTLHYYYTFSGIADSPKAIQQLNPRKILIDEVRNSTSIKTYKDAKYSFHYTYSSASTKKVLADVLITEKDYK